VDLPVEVPGIAGGAGDRHDHQDADHAEDPPESVVPRPDLTMSPGAPPAAGARHLFPEGAQAVLVERGRAGCTVLTTGPDPGWNGPGILWTVGSHDPPR
jgi:hypothetical protein